MVIAELNRQKEILRNKIAEKTKLDNATIDYILTTIDTCLYSMIDMLKEGKTAHEKFFSDIILNSIDAIIGIDNDFKIFLWNKGAEKLFGYTKDEVIGKDFYFLIPDYLLEQGEREFLINEVKEKGFLANHESERITKSGELINVSITRFAIFNDRKPMGSVGILRDITRLKKLQRELSEKENLALIGEVVSSIAHSLANPLNIISGNADYLLLEKDETDAEYDELKTIAEEAGRITKSLRSLLNFSRPLQVEKNNVDLNNVIEDVVQKSKFSVGDKEIVINKDLAEDLPEIIADRIQLEEVITNLVINSIQSFNDHGTVDIITVRNGENLKVIVKDNGPGISKENLEKIFKPFYSSKGYGKGTGLGLPIAKRIVGEHGGSISVNSEPGKETSFTIQLPLN